jgi:hypothetical protein
MRKLLCVCVAFVGLALLRPVMAADPTKGKVLFEEWYSSPTNDINGDLETLKNNARYPNDPDKTYWSTIGMDRPDGGEDYWGCRGRAYLVPPQTGDYTFWTASDDDSELWLSTNEDPANAVMIADVAGWMNYRDFAGASGAPGANFKSDPVTLEAGKRYYIECRQSDGTGGGFVTIAWGGPGIGAGPTVIDAKYFYAFLRDPEPLFLAGTPDPADGAVGVTVPWTTWTSGATAFWHNVYFGTDPNPPFVTQITYNIYLLASDLEPGVTYYWRVDEVELDGVTIHPGPLWKFTAQPYKAFQPTPADGATAQLPGQNLTWGVGKDAEEQHLYFGSDLLAVTNRDASVDKGIFTDPNFKTEALRASTTYYWRVDTIRQDDTIEPGNVWSFTTHDAGATNRILWEWWTGIEGVTVASLTGDPNYPAKVTGSQFVDQFASAVDWNDNYGQRLMGWLKPPESGDYTFWIAGDDQQELWLSTDANPANGQLIANVSGWTTAFDWDNATGQGGGNMMSAAITLQAGEKYFIMALGKDGDGGDSTAVAWQGPGITSREVIKAQYVDVVYLPPLQAFGPLPANRATEIAEAPTLTWNAGEGATKHDLYFGDDANAVAAADTSSSLYKGSKTNTSYDTGTLEWGKTYAWRVDEIGAETVRGSVWTFTTADFIPVDNFESYNDEENMGTRIYETWTDGYTDELSGSIVGNMDPPFAERSIVHGGMQSMPMDYNNINSPFFSSAYREFSPAMNWTVNGVTDLSLWVRGRTAAIDPVVEDNGKMTVSGEGRDIWDAADQFTFVYKTLNGDGSLLAHVVSIGSGTNTWAKGGVMIRDSLDAGSASAQMELTANTDGTAGNGAVFQNRATADLDMAANDSTSTATATEVIAPPYWIKIERTGDTLKGSISPDNNNWTQLGTSQYIAMTNPVYIGFCVTSHQAGEYRTFEFDNVKATGASGSWQTKEIGLIRNSKQLLYVTVEDSSSKTVTVVDPNEAAVTTPVWTEWKIPLTDLAGISLTKVSKLTIGVGDPDNPAPDGTGRVYIDDIRVTRPAPDVTEPAPDANEPAPEESEP